MEKMVYSFDEGNSKMKAVLGGKGANLAEMTSIGLPVPFGLTITCDTCKAYYKNNKKFPQGMWEQVEDKLTLLESKAGKKLGDAANPLLVSVRSGAPVSMPGMMDTILNLGLNDQTVKAVIKKTDNPRFAWDCYRRFVQMFGDVVLGVEHAKFEKILEEIKHTAGVKQDTDMKAEHLEAMVKRFKELIKKETGKDFPVDPREQLKMAIEAVFASWNTPRAITYRKINKISDDLGTAVNVQMMAFGNSGPKSGTGVCFTRNPSTGENKFYGEYLMNAQGEDVVAGIRTPKPIDELGKDMPAAYKQLLEIRGILEKHYKEMQDIEFTIEDSKLYMLQTRTGKRTAHAAVEIAVAMVKEGLIDKEEAIMRVQPEQIDQLLHRHIDPKQKVNPIAKGLPASPGAAVGKAVFSANEAERLGKKGEKVIMLGVETTPDDIHGMVVSQGILTSRGGMTSHAAVVARGMGIPCVCGTEKLLVDLDKKQFTVDGRNDVLIKEGMVITVDGSTGNIMVGEVPLVDPEMTGAGAQVLRWADETRKMHVRANADTPEMAKGARTLGAEGIGLCRTERMFNAPERRAIVQEMVLARNTEGRQKALDKLKPLQKGDYLEIFKVMEGLPVTIRLLDPPLHEFLPDAEELIYKMQELYKEKADTRTIQATQDLLNRVKELREFNPMLGHRGSRLGLTYPEIYKMQVTAIFEAAAELQKKGVKVIPEVMVPLIGNVKEIEMLYPIIKARIEEVLKEQGVKIEYMIGTMIELPRACLVADQIAKHAEFFSFGTNDLTQTALGFSRDDAEAKFMGMYLENKIFKANPFEVLDVEGVGKLITMAIDLGRKSRPKIEIGVCGETGGEPSSIDFYYKAGLDYVSCSRYRVPIARLAAAQAVIREKREAK